MALYQKYIKQEMDRINQTIIQAKEMIELLISIDQQPDVVVEKMRIIRLQLYILKLEKDREILSRQIF